jgi:hypothetical protein
MSAAHKKADYIKLLVAAGQKPPPQKPKPKAHERKIEKKEKKKKPNKRKGTMKPRENAKRHKKTIEIEENYDDSSEEEGELVESSDRRFRGRALSRRSAAADLGGSMTVAMMQKALVANQTLSLLQQEHELKSQVLLRVVLPFVCLTTFSPTEATI